jgi:thioredoxin 1
MISLNAFLFLTMVLFSYFANLNGFMLNPLNIIRKKVSQNMIPVISPSKTTIHPIDNDYQEDKSNTRNHLMHIFDSNFDETILNSQGVSVVLFTADWCAPCKNMALSLDKCAQTNSKAQFYTIDTDFNPETASIYSVRSIPCLLFFKDGDVVSEIVGSVPSNVIEKQLNKYSQGGSSMQIEYFQ